LTGDHSANHKGSEFAAHGQEWPECKLEKGFSGESRELLVKFPEFFFS
jgi:hypothetical protein